MVGPVGREINTQKRALQAKVSALENFGKNYWLTFYNARSGYSNIRL